MSKFTKAQAIDEITWRAIPKPRPARDFTPGAARDASGPELRAKAGQPKPARKAPAVKAPKGEPTPEQLVSKFITRAAQVQAAATEGPGFIKRVINARRDMLNAGDMLAQMVAAATVLAPTGDAEALQVLAEIG